MFTLGKQIPRERVGKESDLEIESCIIEPDIHNSGYVIFNQFVLFTTWRSLSFH